MPTEPVQQPDADHEGLTPLERALITRFEGAISGLTDEIKALRRQAPDRTMLYVIGCLWCLSMFVLGILALDRGVDPRIAAEAVNLARPSAPASAPASTASASTASASTAGSSATLPTEAP